MKLYLALCWVEQGTRLSQAVLFETMEEANEFAQRFVRFFGVSRCDVRIIPVETKQNLASVLLIKQDSVNDLE